VRPVSRDPTGGALSPFGQKFNDNGHKLPDK
jgi:hypothetical protein